MLFTTDIMGVKGLNNFIQSICLKSNITEAFVEKEFTDYKYKKITVDILNKIFAHSIGIRSSGHDKLSGAGKVINHYSAIYNCCQFYISKKIIPIFVFDGETPDIKLQKLKERSDKKKKAHRKTNSIVDKSSDEYIKQFKRTYSITSKHIEECKDFIKACGFPCIDSCGEAESQCVAMSYEKSCNISGIITEDMDSIVFGAPIILKNFSKKNNTVTQISYSHILDAFLIEANKYRSEFNKPLFVGLTAANFIDFVSMFETDYFVGFRSCHFNDIFKLFVKNDMNVETLVNDLIENNQNIFIPRNFIQNWEKVKTYFTNAEVYAPVELDMSFKTPQFNVIKNILSNICCFDKNIVECFICDLNSYYNEILHII